MGEMKYHQWLSRNPSGINGHSVSKLNRLVINGAISLLVATAPFYNQHVDLKLGTNFLVAVCKTETTSSRPDERTFVALVRAILRVFVTGQMLGERDSLQRVLVHTGLVHSLRCTCSPSRKPVRPDARQNFAGRR